jgi:hypothetical protein
MERLIASRERAHGRQIVTPSGLAARLAGGFHSEADRQQLSTAIGLGMAQLSFQELEPLKEMPGAVPAIAETLRKVWAADVLLKELAPQSKRIADIARIEAFVRANLPHGALIPPDLRSAALGKVQFASQAIGPLTIKNVVAIDRCWQPLFKALVERVPIKCLPPRGTSFNSGWLDGLAISMQIEPEFTPVENIEVCANPQHEVVEALRWARELVVSGHAVPQEIAITACSIGDWDDEFRVLAPESHLPIAFIQGHGALSTYAGQQAAALAEILLSGLSHDRVVRGLRLLTSDCPALKQLPKDWYKMLPKDAPLLRRRHWDEVLSTIAEKQQIDLRPVLGTVLDFLERGILDSQEIPKVGEELLKGPALALWRRALVDGPPAALQSTLKELRVPDDNDPAGCIVWGPANAIVGAPRSFVRMLGLTSRHWPRRAAEDSLLPSHVINSKLLQPISLSDQDRDAFFALRGSAQQITYSRSRRDREGRLMGPSSLLPAGISSEPVSRTRVPQHAFSECDRLLARRSEFATTDQGQSARACDHDWRSTNITAHDGLLTENHPAVINAMQRAYSSTALVKFVTDPIGFIWSYALNWKAPDPASVEEPLTLDRRTFGNLVHQILSTTVGMLEANGGLRNASADVITETAATAAISVRGAWEIYTPVPPLRAWEQTLRRASTIAVRALTWPLAPFDKQETFVEIDFGGYRTSESSLWNTETPVVIEDLGLQIAGRIDRIDVDGSRTRARVIDYKTGACPKEDPGLDGGAGLQRSVYALAVRSLLPSVQEISAALLYPGDVSAMFVVKNLDCDIDEVKRLIRLAQANLLSGRGVFGAGAESDYNDLAFAFPAASKYVYFPRKRDSRNALVGELSQLWGDK